MSCSTVGSATFPGTFSATVRLRELGLEGANEKCYMFLPAVEFDNKTIGLGNRGYLKVLNDTKLVLNEHESLNHLGSICYHLEPLFPKPVSWL